LVERPYPQLNDGKKQDLTPYDVPPYNDKRLSYLLLLLNDI